MTPNPPPPSSTPPPDTQAPPKAVSKLMARLQEFAARYGVLAFVVHWTLFFLCLGVFMVLIDRGFKPEGTAGAVGTFAMAYGACQVIKIPRFAATFALTPLIDRIIRRMRNKGPRAGEPPTT